MRSDHAGRPLPGVDPDGDDDVTVAELIAAVNNALAGCDAHPNRAPQASDVSFGADSVDAVRRKAADRVRPGQRHHHLRADRRRGRHRLRPSPTSIPSPGCSTSRSPPDFSGTIVLPYRVTDGQLFSDTANATIEVQARPSSDKSGVAARSIPRSTPAIRAASTTATCWARRASIRRCRRRSISARTSRSPAIRDNQNSCVAWALGYAIKSYQERVELGWSLEPPEHRFSPAYIYNQLNGGQDHGLIYNDALELRRQRRASRRWHACRTTTTTS